MSACPYCGTFITPFTLSCHDCAGDLRPLALLQELPDVQFNAALRAARTADWVSAMNLLGACLTARPGDVDAWVLLGTVHARRGNLALARDCWVMVQSLRRGESRSARGLAAILRIAAERNATATTVDEMPAEGVSGDILTQET